jgi:hypothetical protein
MLAQQTERSGAVVIALASRRRDRAALAADDSCRDWRSQSLLLLLAIVQ